MRLLEVYDFNWWDFGACFLSAESPSKFGQGSENQLRVRKGGVEIPFPVPCEATKQIQSE